MLCVCHCVSMHVSMHVSIVVYLHVFPESLTLREVTDALWSARYKWKSLGRVLGLQSSTIEVIEGHAVS